MINAGSFNQFQGIYYKQFNDLLELLIYSYNEILKNMIFLKGKYDEDILRNIIVDYSRKYQDQFNLSHLLIQPELAENYDLNFKTIGRCDIKIYNLEQVAQGNPIDYDSSYIIECKRLNKNIQSVNRYIDEGISRYTYQLKYAKYTDIAGMISFVEDANIALIIGNIISKLYMNINIVTINNLKKVKIKNNFNYSFKSKHKRQNLKDIEIYHLFFDYSKIIK